MMSNAEYLRIRRMPQQLAAARARVAQIEREMMRRGVQPSGVIGHG